MERKNIAIITARGGSKRIPRKNIKDFLGKPIISYSIRAAIESGCFDTVMVSTDDAEIADIAVSFGAQVPFFRSEATAGDHATTAAVVEEVLEKYASQNNYFEGLCCIYPTAPFLSGKKLKEAMELLWQSEADAVLPVVPFSYPPQRCFVIHEGKVEMKYPEYAQTRSQDLETLYHDCGQFYCIKTEAFMKCGDLATDDTIPYVISELEVQDIDTEADWKLAEMKYKYSCGDANE